MSLFRAFGKGCFKRPFSQSLKTFSEDVQSYIGFELIHAIVPTEGRCGFSYHRTECVGADHRVQRHGNLLQLYDASAGGMFLLRDILCVADSGCPACGQGP